MNESLGGVRLLVAGGAGFLGSRVVRAAEERGIEVGVLARRTTDTWRLPQGIDVVRADASSLPDLARALATFAPTHVVNALGSSRHATTAEARITHWRDSVVSTVTLLEALRRTPVDRLVHVCSSLIYARSDRPHAETDSINPGTGRGAAKAAALLAVRQWAEETGLPMSIVRPFSVYGPNESQDRVVPALLSALRDRRAFAITEAEYRRDFVHVDDVADATVDCMTRAAAIGCEVNLGTGVENSTRDLVEIAESVTGHALVPADGYFAPRPSDRPHWSADRARADKLLGWCPMSLDEGVAVAWDAML